jgi:hypothetical protein
MMNEALCLELMIERGAERKQVATRATLTRFAPGPMLAGSEPGSGKDFPERALFLSIALSRGASKA